MSGVLRPRAHRAAGVADDAAVVQALLRLEAARVLALAGAVTDAHADRVADAATALGVDLPALAEAAEGAGTR